MKKKIAFIVLLTAIIISVVGIVYIFKDKKNEKSKLDEIKEEINETNKIYVCKLSDDSKKEYKSGSDSKNVCKDKYLVKILDDKDKINEFISIFKKLEEEYGDETLVKDPYTLYFLDTNDNIIVAVDFNSHFIVKRVDYVHSLSTKYNDKLKSILEI